jgi:hypothetical protein
MSILKEDEAIETKELRLIDAEGKVQCKLLSTRASPSLHARPARRKATGSRCSQQASRYLAKDDRERVHVALIVTGAELPMSALLTGAVVNST